MTDGAPSSILFLTKPGLLPHHVAGPLNAARALGLCVTTEPVDALWRQRQSDYLGAARAMAARVRRDRIGLVFGYIDHGPTALVVRDAAQAGGRDLFEMLGVSHFCFWTDHPQWAHAQGLSPDFQPVLRSAANHHFLKSAAHARELTQFLQWRHCHALPVAEDAEQIRPARGVAPIYDVVAIGTQSKLEPVLEPLLRAEHPDESEIRQLLAPAVGEQLEAIVRAEVPEAMASEFRSFCRAWLAAQLAAPHRAAVHHYAAVVGAYPGVAGWVAQHPQVYFRCAREFWALRAWRRAFYLQWLSRYYRVGVFGPEWSLSGVNEKTEWIDRSDLAQVYALGRVAINITQGNDEEGLSHKAFEIAASGIPLAHLSTEGLSDCFEVGREVEAFASPDEARACIGRLLEDAPRAQAMGQAARLRLERCHTWIQRLPQMFMKAGLNMDAYRDA